MSLLDSLDPDAWWIIPLLLVVYTAAFVAVALVAIGLCRLVARLTERLFHQLCCYCVCPFWTPTPWRTYYCPHPNCQLASRDLLAADLNQEDDHQ